MITRMVRRTGRDESGAVLVLALIFAVLSAMIVGALATWTANDLKNVGNFKNSRSMLSVADSAMQSAISGIRYSYPASTSGFCTSGTGGTSSYSVPGSTWNVDVTCTTTNLNPASSASRTVTISAYLESAFCGATLCDPATSPLIQAQVTFDDISGYPKYTNDCLSTTSQQTTCGFGMTVNSWVVQPN
jgi:hypothetical protein